MDQYIASEYSVFNYLLLAVALNIKANVVRLEQADVYLDYYNHGYSWWESQHWIGAFMDEWRLYDPLDTYNLEDEYGEIRYFNIRHRLVSPRTKHKGKRQHRK